MVNRPDAGPIPTPGPAPTTPPPAELEASADRAAPTDSMTTIDPVATTDSAATTEPTITVEPVERGAGVHGLGLFDNDARGAGLAPVVVPPSAATPAAPVGPVERVAERLGLADMLGTGAGGAASAVSLAQVLLIVGAVVLAGMALAFSLTRMVEADPAPTTVPAVDGATTSLPTLTPGSD